jgi:hypothetical protein
MYSFCLCGSNMTSSPSISLSSMPLSQYKTVKGPSSSHIGKRSKALSNGLCRDVLSVCPERLFDRNDSCTSSLQMMKLYNVIILRSGCCTSSRWSTKGYQRSQLLCSFVYYCGVHPCVAQPTNRYMHLYSFLVEIDFRGFSVFTMQLEEFFKQINFITNFCLVYSSVDKS